MSRDASRKALADLRDGDEENAESSDPTWVPLADIRVPHAFLRTRTNPQKTVELQAWVRAYGVLDQPLVVTRRGGRCGGERGRVKRDTGGA